ncbi:macrolide ABC transporter permease/ATP-binding protein MacB [Nitrincola tibetensis]|uniref:Pyoverdine export ATP-binding/permease protein PvdT n=1 Tax=Nitrincola tibetensis TaxID=2219697 RepID=A0A364NKB1_9GAMM|nr:MacB family efflux pump subunit [Nitrincola tibetensis]RAU17512.1 macrolide ABC transporter permease/ATP-binding protein MacB [Nitrincola tibetensis]
MDAQNVKPIIELKSIKRSFPSGEGTVDVLKGLDLKIMPGEFVAIIGSSGSGKSTLMNILGCLDRPTSGQYLFNGVDVSDLSKDELAGLRREAFGFVFQSYNLLSGSTALENVEVPAVYAGMPVEEREERAFALLESLGLGDRADHRPSQLSGGQQQRVSIARALMNGGQIILADEPTGALDSQTGKEVMALFATLAQQGHTLILITHDQKVASHADRIIEISDGVIVSDPGTSQALNPAPKEKVESDYSGDAGHLVEAFRMSLRALRANLFRTALTLLGIVIGVASVITMLGIGDGAKQAVVDRISSMGSNLLLIRPGAPNQRGWGATSLTPEDVDAINELPGILAAIPELSGSVTLRAGGRDHQTEVMATSSAFPVVRAWNVERGTFFTPDDDVNYSSVALMGQTAANALFPGQDPVGQYVMINNIMFQIIGTMSTRGASPFGRDEDDVVIVPYQTGSLRLFGQRYLRSITVSVEELNEIDEMQDQVHNLLLSRHGTEDFQIRNMASIIESVSETQNTMTLLLGSIAAISLLVGGIGVMNIMLVSVTERTREIGVRMATGARTMNIMQQFLVEAVLVSALGGLIGVALGLGVTWLIGYLGTPVMFSLLPVTMAFGCAFLTGLLFGFLPARKAAYLDPVVALASE